MDEEKKKKKINRWVIFGVIALIVVAAIFLILKLFDFSSLKTTENYETGQYKQYLTGLKEYVSSMDRNMSVEDAEVDFLEKVQEYGKTYEDGNGTGYANILLTNTVTSNNSNDTGSFLDNLIGILDSLLNTNIGIRK